jgi:hypothetical protein
MSDCVLPTDTSQILGSPEAGLTRVNLHSYLTESQFSNLSYELLLLRVLLWYLVE